MNKFLFRFLLVLTGISFTVLVFLLCSFVNVLQML